MRAKSLSRVQLCNPRDCSPPGSSVHGLLQARILEGLPCPLPGLFPTQGLNPGLLTSLRWQVGSGPSPTSHASDWPHPLAQMRPRETHKKASLIVTNQARRVRTGKAGRWRESVAGEGRVGCRLARGRGDASPSYRAKRGPGSGPASPATLASEAPCPAPGSQEESARPEVRRGWGWGALLRPHPPGAMLAFSPCQL